MLHHRGRATLLIFFAFFTFLRVFSHGLPPIEISIENQIQRGGSLHEAEAVAGGEKWIATKWMQVAEESPASG